MNNQSARAGIMAATLAVVALLSTPPAQAEIERLAKPGDQALIFYWWPKVTAPAGWFRDESLSLEQGVNLLLLKGQTFDGSPAVMYTRAFSHENRDAREGLAATIANDHREFLARDPKMKIEEIAPTPTGDGKKLRTFAFTPSAQGSFELVAYGDEPGYVIMFCVSANSAQLLGEHREAFLAMVRSYTSKDGD
jgi:hypothetical protein